MPSASVTTVRVTFVSTLRAETVAAGTTSPWLSITTPWIAPVMDCAARGAAQASAASRQQITKDGDAVLIDSLQTKGALYCRGEHVKNADRLHPQFLARLCHGWAQTP